MLARSAGVHCSIAFGVIATRNYVKLIAFASLNHGGVIAIGLGIGKSAAYGVVLYAVSNAFIKAILFLTAGKIQAHYGTEDVRSSGAIGFVMKEMHRLQRDFFRAGVAAAADDPRQPHHGGVLLAVRQAIARARPLAIASARPRGTMVICAAATSIAAQLNITPAEALLAGFVEVGPL